MALASALLKLAVFLTNSMPFNSDEAVVALMARHFLQGRWTAFFYGQAYMGSLDAALVALGFAAFGQRVEVIRWIQLLLYAGTVFTSVVLTWRLTRSMIAGSVAGLLLAVPPVNILLYTSVSLGGYGEALLLGNLILLLTLNLMEREASPGLCAMWGLLAGLAFWAFGLSLVYSLPAAAALAWHQRRDRLRGRGWLAAAAGGAVGMAPLLVWAASHGTALVVQELLGSAIAGASPSSLLAAWLEHGRNLALLGSTVILGFRPPWDVRWLALPLLPFSLAFWSAVSVHTLSALRRRDEARLGRAMVAGVGAATLIGFVLTPFGADPSGRYFLPLAMPMAFFAGSMMHDVVSRGGRRWLVSIVALVLAFNLWGIIDGVSRNPPGLTTQFDPVTRIDHRSDNELIRFLIQNDERAGYANYWVAYPLAFLSAEELIFVPRLPYHVDMRYTPRDDRYSPYDERVEKSASVAYITTNHPDLDEVIRQGLTGLGVSFEETSIGSYHVFFSLSSRVTPELLGLPAEGEAR